MNARITLEQWQALVAVVDAGGYAQAAERLHKSQSSVTYLVQKLESLLDVKVFEIKGRKAALTPAGQLLYRRARVLLDEAAGIEKAAKSASAGWEAEIRIAAEIVKGVKAITHRKRAVLLSRDTSFNKRSSFALLEASRELPC